jgi:hypothetical protein
LAPTSAQATGSRSIRTASTFFADASDDHQWIHLDVERAQDGPFKTTIAHGYLTMSLAPIFLCDTLVIVNVESIVNYGINTGEVSCAGACRLPDPGTCHARAGDPARAAASKPRSD